MRVRTVLLTMVFVFSLMPWAYADEPSVSMALPPADAEESTVIGFVSCLKTDKPAPIFDHLLAAKPDVLLMLGDNVYVDKPRVPKRAEEFRPVYDVLAAQPYWPRIRNEVPLTLATWDDHDYGKNDAGQEWKLKDAGKAEFLRFFPASAEHVPADREGIYHATTVGEEGQRVQFIMLDTRWFREGLQRKTWTGRRVGGPYRPMDDASRTLLGEAQWAWLEDELRKPADVRMIVSSIQVVAREHGWECWGNFPHELDRLYRLIDDTAANGVVFVSGDRHLAELSCDVDATTPYPMWDATSSGTNQDQRTVNEPNRYRVGGVHRLSNIGLIRIDWSEAPRLTFELVGEDGAAFETQTMSLADLQVTAKQAEANRSD